MSKPPINETEKNLLICTNILVTSADEVPVKKLIQLILFLPSAGIIRIRFKGMISARNIKAPHLLIVQR